MKRPRKKKDQKIYENGIEIFVFCSPSPVHPLQHIPPGAALFNRAEPHLGRRQVHGTLLSLLLSLLLLLLIFLLLFLIFLLIFLVLLLLLLGGVGGGSAERAQSGGMCFSQKSMA